MATILATGHVTMSPQTTLNLGTYTSGQEATLVTGLTGADKGKTWFNSTTNQLMYYDGTTARPIARDVSDIQSAPGKYLTYMPNNTACAGGEFLQWSGANLRWECRTAAGRSGFLRVMSPPRVLALWPRLSRPTR